MTGVCRITLYLCFSPQGCDSVITRCAELLPTVCICIIAVNQLGEKEGIIAVGLLQSLPLSPTCPNDSLLSQPL